MGFQSETSVFKFSWRSVDRKHLMRFQSETSVFKFPRRSVDGELLALSPHIPAPATLELVTCFPALGKG